MAVSFVSAGALANNATTVTLACIAPTCLVDDILICAINQKANQVISAPDGTWTQILQVNNTANQRVSLFWKRATASGGTFNFTKPVDDNLLFCGCISVWRGCLTTATPIDATAPSQSLNASADAVTYADFDPTETSAFIVAIGFYNDDLTTAGSISGTNPTFANNWDLETATGTDASIFGKSGASNGAATGARSHTTTSTVDAVNVGIMLGLVAAPVAPPIACSEPVAELVDTTDTTVYTMTSFQPDANCTLIVFAMITGHILVPTMAGGGFTWTLITARTFNTTDQTLAFWANTGSAPAPCAPQLTISAPALGCVMAAFQWSNSAANAGNPVRQSAIAAGTATANPAATFSLAKGTLNGYCAAFGINRAAPGSTPPASWTETCDTGYATPNAGMAAAFRAGGETSTGVTFTAASGNWGMVAVEVYVEGAAPGGQPLAKRWGGIPGMVGYGGRGGRRM